MIPTVEEVERVIGGRDVRIPVSAAVGAVVAEVESITGWRPLWAPSDVVRSLVVTTDGGVWVELPEPCQSVQSVTDDGGAVGFRAMGDGVRVLGVVLDRPSDGPLTMVVSGGAFHNVPGDLRTVMILRAAETATSDPGVYDVSRISVGGLSVERPSTGLFERVCRRYSRVLL